MVWLGFEPGTAEWKAQMNRLSYDTSLSILLWAVVVTQLVERLLPIPRVRSLNPVISKNLYLY